MTITVLKNEGKPVKQRLRREPPLSGDMTHDIIFYFREKNKLSHNNIISRTVLKAAGKCKGFRTIVAMKRYIHMKELPSL